MQHRILFAVAATTIGIFGAGGVASPIVGPWALAPAPLPADTRSTIDTNVPAIPVTVQPPTPIDDEPQQEEQDDDSHQFLQPPVREHVPAWNDRMPQGGGGGGGGGQAATWLRVRKREARPPTIVVTPPDSEQGYKVPAPKAEPMPPNDLRKNPQPGPSAGEQYLQQAGRPYNGGDGGGDGSAGCLDSFCGIQK